MVPALVQGAAAGVVSVGLGAAGLGLAVAGSSSLASASVLALSVMAFGVMGGVASTQAIRQAANFVPTSSSTSDLLDVAEIVDEQYLRDKGGHWWVVIQVYGLDYGSVAESYARSLEDVRARLITALGQEDISFSFVALREPVSVDLEAQYKNSVLTEIHKRWQDGFHGAHRNVYYIVLHKKKGTKALKILQDKAAETLATLGKYEPSILKDEPQAAVSPLRSWLATLISGQQVKASAKDDMGGLGVTDIGFDVTSGRIIHQYAGRRWIGAILRIRDWGRSDSSALFAAALRLETRVELWMQGEPMGAGRATVGLTADRNIRRFGGGGEIVQDFADALDAVSSGDESYVLAQAYLVIYASDEERLDHFIQYLTRYGREIGHVPMTETRYTRAVWCTRLPGSWRLTRPRRISNKNIAALMPWVAEPTGLDRCDWGPGPLRYFKTAGGGVYGLNLHSHAGKQAACNSVTFGGIDSGKSALWQFLIGGVLRHTDTRVYGFDSREGLRVFTEASGGRYLNAGNASDVALNPLQYMDDDADLSFLNQFIRLLADYDTSGDASRSDDGVQVYTEIQQALRLIRDVPATKRTLSSIWNSAFPASSPLRDRLRKWADVDGVARLFNAQKDSLDPENERFVVFAMDEWLGDPLVAGAMISYIGHRLKRIGRGSNPRPHLLLVDETKVFIENRGFRTLYQEWLRQIRKDRGGVQSIFQDPGALLAYPEVTGNMATNVHLRFAFKNPGAVTEDYRAVGFSDNEINIIRGNTEFTAHLNRWCLIKKAEETVILDVDLTCLGPYLRFLRGGAEPVKLMKELKATYGVDGWVGGYVNWNA
jgi:type IV secretion system protein VirB4